MDPWINGSVDIGASAGGSESRRKRVQSMLSDSGVVRKACQVSEVTVREKFGDRASCILQRCHTSMHPCTHAPMCLGLDDATCGRCSLLSLRLQRRKGTEVCMFIAQCFVLQWSSSSRVRNVGSYLLSVRDLLHSLRRAWTQCPKLCRWYHN